jgi:hypothetical protein
MDHIESLDQEMHGRGASVRVISDVHNESSDSISELISMLERGVWSACWAIDEDTRRAAGAATRKWAATEFGDLEVRRPARHESDWRAYVLP